jgi:putative spermidine/putrescine transport system ATP-binding protein
MSQGAVAQIGTPEALYRNPTTGFVAQFVGDAMRLGGRIEGDTLHIPGGALVLPGTATGEVLVRAEDIRMGPDVLGDDQAQAVVPAGHWQAARSLVPRASSLLIRIRRRSSREATVGCAIAQ